MIFVNNGGPGGRIRPAVLCYTVVAAMNMNVIRTRGIMRFRIVFFGCKVNQYEAELLRQAILKHVPGSVDISGGGDDNGMDEVAGESDNGGKPDLVVVHTCTVTGESDSKCRRAIRHFARIFPRAMIAVSGCYARRAPELFAPLRFPEVGRVLGSPDAIADFLAELDGATENVVECARSAISETLVAGLQKFPRLSRAVLKVQEGCTQRCSYCIVPDTRPGLTSRPMEVVVAEAQRLISAGHAELVLTGTHLGLYGLNRRPDDLATAAFDAESAAPESDKSLAELVRRLVTMEHEHPYRIRLSSLEAPELTPQLLDIAAEYPDRFCPHFHLPMQHASDAVLHRMRRRGDSGRFEELCAQVRQRLPCVVLTTDVMVGFPGETEEDFIRLGDAIERIGFGGVHIFRYSRREGTPAAALDGQIPGDVKRRRATELAERVRRIQRKVWRRHAAQYPQRRVVIENRLPDVPGFAIGTDQFYATCIVPVGPDPLPVWCDVIVSPVLKENDGGNEPPQLVTSATLRKSSPSIPGNNTT